jgi:hypothetical protein
VTATRSLAFTTAKGVIDRVHGDTTGLRAHSLPTVTTCLTNREQLKLSVTNLADGGPSIGRNPPHLCRWKPKRSVYLVTTDELDTHARTSSDFASLPRTQFDVVDYRPDWDSPQRQGITNSDIGTNTRLNLIADLQPSGSKNISLLTVMIME